jgi:RND family efflux transporter MFP subunit
MDTATRKGAFVSTRSATLRFGTGLTAAVALLALTACRATQAASPGGPPPAPPDVSVITVAPEHVALTSEWIATLDGYVNAQIHPQVSGYLIKRSYREGAAVHKGDVLFEIDPRPLNAVLTQATAQVAQAEAQLANSARDVERDTPLAAQQAIAQSQLDAEIQAYRAAEANVQSLKAAVETARLNVGFTNVTSLIDGVAAIATAQIGDLVGPATLLTTISQVSPIKAYFAVSEVDYLQMAGRINGGGKAPWAGGAALTLVLADGSVYPRAGSFLAADREIDAKTGTIRICAIFPNPDRTLRPGQYGRVRAETRLQTDALLVPQRAVSELQGSRQVRVVGPDNKVSTKTVKVGDRLGSQWIIDEGLQPGAHVVVEGARVPDGTVVNPKPFAAPTKAR